MSQKQYEQIQNALNQMNAEKGANEKPEDPRQIKSGS
jgi:hypothetical protein